FGAQVTFTATVSGPGDTPTGSVTFFEGETALQTVSLGNGMATLGLSTLAVGNHTITAHYNGDDNYNESDSDDWTQTVVKAATTTALTAAPNPAAVGANTTLTATVSSAGG